MRMLTYNYVNLGVQPRTLEVLQTLDLQYALDCKGNRVCEAAFWGVNSLGNLERTHVGPEVIPATPYPWILAVSQRETEKAFDCDLNGRGHSVDRPAQLLHFDYSNDPQYPIHALVKNKYSHVTSLYRCKYLVASDGAGSTTRRLLGIQADCSGQDDVWVVADMDFETNFPDIRRRSMIRSRYGAIMLIPNSGGGNRVYTQLSPTEVADLGGIDESQSMTLESRLRKTEWNDTTMLEILQTRFKEVLKQYTGNIRKLHWISQYRVKQRIIQEFSDRARVFIVGDACHTHSPKAAQGLNISMMDSYNLTWKLALVLQQKARPELLETYNRERKQIAQELIDFDLRFSHLFAKKEFLDNNAEFHDVYKKAHGFTTGVGLHYQQNLLTNYSVDVPINTESLEPLNPGKRFYTVTATRHIDGTAVNLLDEMPSNGRFHLIIFAGNAISQDRLVRCAEYLNSADSILTRYSSSYSKDWAFENIRRSSSKNNGRVVDLFLIHTDNYYDFDLAKLPAPFPNWKYRIYVDKQGREHEDHGIDPKVGAMALVRPDGYISLITSLEGGPAISNFMDRFMIVPEAASSGVD